MNGQAKKLLVFCDSGGVSLQISVVSDFGFRSKDPFAMKFF